MGIFDSILRHGETFHASCPESSTSIAYNVLRQVGKEVSVVLHRYFVSWLTCSRLREPAPGTDAVPLQTGGPNLRVFKVVKKTVVKIFYAQHNLVRPSAFVLQIEPRTGAQ
jgi:hypothetical protein